MTHSQNQPHDKLNIAIAVSTYNRHEGLLNLLDSLDHQKIDENVIGSWCVIIVDNSPDFNCRSLLDDKQYRFEHILCHEPQGGISYARNKGVSEAKGTDFVAFVDDDEFAEDDWLMQLVNCQRKYQCAVVQGPVPVVFEHPVKKWYHYFHQHPRDIKAQKPTGERLPTMATGNALVAMDALRDIKGPFDPETALMGGEDALLGRQLTARGHAIIWCGEAIAYEIIPPERTNLKWCLKKSFHGGNRVTFTSLFLNKSKGVRLRRLVVSFVRICQGLVLFPLFLLPIRCRLRGPCWIAYGLGSLTGLFNYRFQGYKRKTTKK